MYLDKEIASFIDDQVSFLSELEGFFEDVAKPIEGLVRLIGALESAAQREDTLDSAHFALGAVLKFLSDIHVPAEQQKPLISLRDSLIDFKIGARNPYFFRRTPPNRAPRPIGFQIDMARAAAHIDLLMEKQKNSLDQAATEVAKSLAENGTKLPISGEQLPSTYLKNWRTRIKRGKMIKDVVFAYRYGRVFYKLDDRKALFEFWKRNKGSLFS